MTKKPIWWISWYSPEALGGFTLTLPWWRSGWAIQEDNSELTLFVGAVRADTEDEAFAIIEAAYDTPPDEGVTRRFAKKIDDGEELPWEHEGTRFPLGEWMEWE